MNGHCSHFFISIIWVDQHSLTERMDEGDAEIKFSVTFLCCYFIGLKCLREKRTCCLWFCLFLFMNFSYVKFLS